MHTDPTRVLYISGAGRSGTTVLNGILDTLNGVSAFGEVWHFWKVVQDVDHRCGCRELLADCPLWSPVIEDYPSPDSIREMEGLRLSVGRIRQIWRIGRRSRRDSPELRMFTDAAARIYRTLALHAECATLVDSSKTPAFAMLVGSSPEVSMRIVHLVRDPRAVVASWSRQKQSRGVEHPESLEARSLGHVLREWMFFNTIGLKYLRRRFPTMVVRLEDLVDDPTTTLEAIRGFAGVDATASLVSPDGRVMVGGAHSVAGNPDRFATGSTKLHASEDWRTLLPWWKRLVVTVVTYPVMRHYGYL